MHNAMRARYVLQKLCASIYHKGFVEVRTGYLQHGFKQKLGYKKSRDFQPKYGFIFEKRFTICIGDNFGVSSMGCHGVRFSQVNQWFDTQDFVETL